jgi:hypothetical protein
VTKRAIIFVLIGCCLALFLCGCSTGDKEVSLRLKLTPNLELKYRQVTKGSIQTYHGDSLTSNRHNELTWDILWQVKRVLEDGTAEIYETKSYRLYSKNEKDSVLSDTVYEGDPYILYMQPNGKIVDLDFAKPSSSVDLAYAQDYWQQGTAVYPEGQHGPGYSWTQTTRVVLPDGPIEASTTYTIKSLVRERGYDCAVIEYDGNMVLPIQPFRRESSSPGEAFDQISGVDRIKASGNLYFAYKEGVIVLQRERWTLDGERVRRYDKSSENVITRVHIEYDVDHSLIEMKPKP